MDLGCRDSAYTLMAAIIRSGRKVTMVRKILAVLVALGLLGVVTACNTFAGAGKDIQRGGEVIEDAAKDTQNDM